VADARVRWLLWIAGALAVARFLVVPWVDAQNEQRQQLEVLTQRLDRSEGVARNRDAILIARDALVKDAEAAFGAFPAADDDDPRLMVQRRLNSLATQAGVQLTLFDWLLDGEAGEAGLGYSRASVRLEGPLDRLILLHGELAGSMPFLAVRDLQIRMKSAASGPLGSTASATMVLDAFYRPASPEAAAQESAK